MEVIMKKVLLLTLLFLLINTHVFALEISAPHAILIDVDSGKTLYEHDAYSATYPASTTKILTAILVLEQCELAEKVTASYEAINSVYAGGTTASLQEGETHTVKDLLSTMLIHSSNDAAYVLAEHVGGTTASFASMMNARAKELGAKSTYFVNPNGLPSSDHVCSAYDMAIFARYAMENFPDFREIVRKKNYTLPITPEYTKLYMNQYPEAKSVTRYLTTTTNHLINPNRSEYYYEYATGIKTGYTDAAANCIVASAEKDGVELIVVIFGAGGWKNLRNDCVTLFEYGFENLHSEILVTAGEIIEKKEIENGKQDDNILKIIAENNLTATVSNSDYIEAFSPSIVINTDLKAPIKSGDVIGTITYDIYNSTYTSNLLAGNSIKEKVTITKVAVNIFGIIVKIIIWSVGIIVGLFILLVLLRAYFMTQKQKRRSRHRKVYNSRFR